MPMSYRRLLARDRRKAAVHEAGHVVIARMFGLTDIDAHIRRHFESSIYEKTWVGQTGFSKRYFSASGHGYTD